ncbi:heat shock 70 kDa protein 18-like [Chenopodium quinoa]|uniref:heat shock 70 kDa protein 18-like n=1 Tax=Chenopodium quinoa TaxID=63459 RepID=UPI000B78AD8A|nr:heat shock 70 kDa protein 18-like [Chenopodium quinoa]
MESDWGWPAIGIDLGDRFSRVAIWQHGKVEIIVNDQGNRKTLSYVAFTDNEHLIGDAAKNQSSQNPAITIFDVYKLIGRTFSDVTAQYDIKSWPFKVVAGANDKPKIVVSYQGKEKQFAAEEICSMVLMKMKETAEAYLGVEVKYAVVTVPAYFNDSQRQATKDAGIMAGLKSVHIIKEPTAVVIAYGLHEQLASSCLGNNVLVFNQGGRTLDVSLLTINEDIVEFKAVCWDPELGGDAFDKKMANYFIQLFEPWACHISENPEHLGRLVASCERAKRSISTCSETVINLYSHSVGKYFSTNITRANFERLSNYLIKDCMRLVEKCLRSAKLEREDIHYVILVGGSTRIPKVQQMLQEFFLWEKLLNSFNSEEVVAYGAAIHAAMLSHVDVSPIFYSAELHLGKIHICSSIIFLLKKKKKIHPPLRRGRCIIGIIIHDLGYLGALFTPLLAVSGVSDCTLVQLLKTVLWYSVKGREVQYNPGESSTSLILNDIDSLLEDLYKVSKKKSISISSSKVQFLKLLEEIRRNPNDLHFTGELSQLLQDFHPSLPMHSLTVIKSLEEDILASQHRFMEWTKKEVAAPLKLREAGTIQSRLVNIKNQILQKTSSRDQLRSRIAETDKEIAKLMNCKSQLEKDHCLADQDLGRLTRSICPQVDVARQKSAQLAHLREASNFKAKAWFSLEAALDSFANYLKNL